MLVEGDTTWNGFVLLPENLEPRGNQLELTRRSNRMKSMTIERFMIFSFFLMMHFLHVSGVLIENLNRFRIILMGSKHHGHELRDLEI